MKEFQYYIIYICKCRGSDYRECNLGSISFILLDKIIELFNLDQTMLIENEIYKFI
jgi:hypothetical protein